MTLHQVGNLPAKIENVCYIKMFAQYAGLDLDASECIKLVSKAQDGERVRDLIGKLTPTM